jgi:GNAT superfamily N-acetyltransferase
MEYKIKKATIKDITVLMRLQYAMKQDEKKYMQGLNKKGKFITWSKSKLRNILTSPNGYIILVKIGGIAIGCGLAIIEKGHSWMKYNKIGHLGMIYVEKKYRRKGIATALKNQRIKWLKSKGIKFCYVSVFPGNKPSLKYQEKLGFKPYNIKLYKKI